VARRPRRRGWSLQARGPGRLLHQRGDAARAVSGRRRGRSPSGWARRCPTPGRRADPLRDRRAWVREPFLSDGWHAGRWRRSSPRVIVTGVGRRSRRAGAGRVRVLQPHRAAVAASGPSRRLRRRAGADPRASRPRRLRDSYFNDAAARSGCSANQCSASRGEAVPRRLSGEYIGPSWRRRFPASSRCRLRKPHRAPSSCAGSDQGNARALRVHYDRSS